MRFWHFSKGFFLAEIREFEVIFWTFVFPLLLYFFLSAVLGSEGKEGGASFNLAVLGNSASPMGTRIFNQTIDAISQEEGPFKTSTFQDLESAIIAMKRGRQDAVAILGGAQNADSRSIPIQIHFIKGRESSQVAANILELAFEKANLEVAMQSGQEFRPVSSEAIPVKNSISSKRIAYKDYIFPSVALMMILSVALFNSPISLSSYRNSGTNKKLFTTPLRPLEYFAAHLVKLLVTMLGSLILLYLMAWLIYRVRSGIFSLAFFSTLLLAMFCLVSFGLMLASFTRKESAAVVLGQIFYQIMMFMGGFFFSVFGLPWAIRWLVYLLPTTYLVELLRRAMGVTGAPIELFWLIAVPVAWLILSVAIFALNFHKVMGNE